MAADTGTLSPPDIRCYTPVTLARRWRCRPSHVRKLIRRGSLPAFDLGGQGRRSAVRVSPEAVIAFEQQHAAAPRKPERMRRRQEAGVIDYYPD